MVVKLPAPRGGFVRLPRRQVVEHFLVGASSFRRLVGDEKRALDTVVDFHTDTVIRPMLKKAVLLAAGP